MDCDSCNHVGYHLRRIDNLLMRSTTSLARSMGLDEVTVMNGWILTYLDRNSDRDIYQKDIEMQFGIKRSTVTNIVKLMEKKGLISRQTVPRDARLKKLVLTEKGKWAREVSYEAIKMTEEKIKRGISEEEIHYLCDIIEKMRKNLDVE